MGSVNCKDYVTAGNNGNLGTTGSYHSKSESTMEDQYLEPVTICNEADIQENEMKEFALNDKLKVLLVRQNGIVSAIGNLCPHYNAPLVNGALGQGRIRCPWHGACFNTETGDIEDFPGMDSLPLYKVERKDGKIQVCTTNRQLLSNKHIRYMAQRDSNNSEVYVVVGGGVAGGVCAETLRKEGFTGRIVMINRENALPYDRVKISKNMSAKLEQIQFRPQEFYDKHSIETWLNVEATNLDSENKILNCSNGESLKFDKMFIATGMNARKLPLKGWELENVITLRDFSDNKHLQSLISPDLKVVCLGSSFIAMEVAQALVKSVKSVTVIGRTEYPLEASFGSKIGERILRLYNEKGVNMFMNNGILQILGNQDGKVCGVVLSDQSQLDCDLLIMGVGGHSNTDFLKDSGVNLCENGAVETNMYLQSNVPDIYVGGDIALAPVYCIGNEKSQIGHYQLAQYHAHIAASNMTGTLRKLEAVPFFFTMLFGKGFRYAGHGPYSDIFIDGDIEEFKFVAYYLNENKEVTAALSVGRDPVVSQFAELKSQGKRLFLQDIADDPLAWTKKLLRPAC